MKSLLIRASSVPVQSPHVSGSPRVCLSRSDSLYGVFSGENSNVCRPKASLHFDVDRRGDKGIRRILSENDVIRWVNDFSGGSIRSSRCYAARIPEEEKVSEGGDDDDGGSLSLRTNASFSGVWAECGIPLEDLGFSGGGRGSDDCGFGSFSGGYSDRSKIGEYYQKMLKKNPSDSLLLRNYGKFLHEVLFLFTIQTDQKLRFWILYISYWIDDWLTDWVWCDWKKKKGWERYRASWRVLQQRHISKSWRWRIAFTVWKTNLGDSERRRPSQVLLRSGRSCLPWWLVKFPSSLSNRLFYTLKILIFLGII